MGGSSSIHEALPSSPSLHPRTIKDLNDCDTVSESKAEGFMPDGPTSCAEVFEFLEIAICKGKLLDVGASWSMLLRRAELCSISRRRRYYGGGPGERRLRSDLANKTAAVALQLEEQFFVHAPPVSMTCTVNSTENQYALAIVCTILFPDFSWLYPQNVQ
jgi:hypothetical protein